MSQPTEHTPPTTDPKPENGAATSESTWVRRYREGLAQLESLWKEAQKYQEESLRRAKATADDLGKTLAATYADTSERLVKLAAEAKARSAELYGRAQEKILERKGGAKSEAAEAKSEAAEAKGESADAKSEAAPQVVVEPPKPPPSAADSKTDAPN